MAADIGGTAKPAAIWDTPAILVVTAQSVARRGPCKAD